MGPDTVRLSGATLAQIGAGGQVSVPHYDRSRVTRGIVHVGVGGFFRAHQAMYLDSLMNEGQALDYGICGVAALPHDRRIYEAMTAQDCLYTLVLKHPSGTLEPRVIGSMTSMLYAPDDPQAVVDTMADPATKIVSLTITEGGYLVDQVTGEFQVGHPSIQADLVPGAVPSTAFGFIVAALAARRAAGQQPFTVQSCDNLPGNGDVAKKSIVAFARLIDPELADWIADNVSFPNAMVDRITPVTADADREALAERFGVQDAWPVVCEPFTQWVIEDHFPAGRPAWEHVGAQLVEDVEPYELMKLRLLNASHQALTYLGYLAGYRFAHEVCSDQLFRDFLLRYMEREGSPTLPPVPGVDLAAYRHELIDRFANSAVRDTLARLCAESSDRIPKWLVPVVQANLDVGGEIDASALVVASWVRYAEGVDEQGEPIDIVDNAKDRVLAAAQASKEDPLEFLRMRDFFGDLAENERFAAAYRTHLDDLRSSGARATLSAFMGEVPGALTADPGAAMPTAGPASATGGPGGDPISETSSFPTSIFPTSMAGVRLPGDSTVEHVTVPVPTPGPGQVLLKVKASSICGSDIRAIYREHLGHGAEAYQGVIAGHEPCGQVVALGPGARRLTVGDRVVVYHIAGCGMCEECRRGYQVACEAPFRAAHGWQRDGGHAEYLLAEEATCVLLPEPLTYVDGALVSCGFGTAYEGLLKAGVGGRDRLLVTGLGPVGLATAMLGRALGATTVVGSDVSRQRREAALELGLVDVAVAPEDLDEAVAAATGGRGCEVAIDCSGNAAAREGALRNTRAWGRCVFVGEGGSVRFAVSDLLIHKQITLRGSWVTSVLHMEDLLEQLVRWHLHPEVVVTHRLALSDAARAYEIADAGEGGKVCLVFDEPPTA